MNIDPYIIMNKYSFMNIVIHFLATCKLFLQKKDIFPSKTSFGLLISRKNFNVNYRKEQRHGMNHVFTKNYE